MTTQSLDHQIAQNQSIRNKVKELARVIDEGSALMFEINEELLKSEEELKYCENEIRRKILIMSKKAINVPMLQLIVDKHS